MKKIITSPYRKMRLLLILPVFATILYAFAEAEYDYVYSDSQSTTDISVITTKEKEVKGTVIQEDGRPLPGAIVVASGTTLGASADSKGYFILKGMIPEDADLVISFVGFKTKVVKPDFTSDMTIRMIMDTIKLERKSKSSNASPQKSSSVIVSEMKKPSPIFSVHGEGPPPIYVINGKVITADEAKIIDYESIESVTIMKNRASVELYGGKNESGVILINTKNKGSGLPAPAPVDSVNIKPKTPLSASEINDIRSDQSPKPGKSDNQTDPKAPFIVVEELPAFSGGGEDAMFEWIAQNLRYPARARKQKIEGTVRVKFLINPEGKVSDALVVKSDNALFDKEAKRIITNMPDWKPGIQSGKAVSVYYMVPVEFRLTSENESMKP